MKNSKIFLLVLFTIACITTIHFVGCKENSSEPEERAFKNPYTQIGEIHNQTLEYVFNNITINKFETDSTKFKAHLMSQLKNLLDQIVKEKKVVVDFNYLLGKDTNLLKKVADMPECQKYYIDKIDYLLATNKDEQSLTIEIQKIEKEANDKLDELDKTAVLGYSAIAMSSRSYWKANLSDLLKKLPNDTKLKKINEEPMSLEGFLWNIVKADAAGLLAYAYEVGVFGTALSWEAAGIAAGAASSFYVLTVFVEMFIDYFSGLAG